MKLQQFTPGSVSYEWDAVGNVTERHSSVCAHCQSITEFESRRKMQDHVDVCRTCMRLICIPCTGKPCRPWEKEMERQEARYRFLCDAGLA